jgi:hypothetical protein
MARNMGAWSEDTFGNDKACDWAGSFLSKPGLEAVREAIDAVVDAEDSVEAGEACKALAACEVIARWQGRWGVRDAYSEDLDRWVEANPMTVPKDLKEAAESAMQKILGPNSELQELWDEPERSEKWHEVMEDLRERVRG